MNRTFSVAKAALLSVALLGAGALAQDLTVIRAGSLFDPNSGEVARDQLILI